MISLNFFPTQDGNGQQNGRVIARVCVENFIYRHNAATNHQQERRFKYSRLDLVTLDYQTGDVLNNAAEPVQITAAGFVSTGGNNLHLPAAQIFSINPVEDHTRDCRVASISTTGRGHCVCAVQYNDLHQPAIREVSTSLIQTFQFLLLTRINRLGELNVPSSRPNKMCSWKSRKMVYGFWWFLLIFYPFSGFASKSSPFGSRLFLVSLGLNYCYGGHLGVADVRDVGCAALPFPLVLCNCNLVIISYFPHSCFQNGRLDLLLYCICFL